MWASGLGLCIIHPAGGTGEGKGETSPSVGADSEGLAVVDSPREAVVWSILLCVNGNQGISPSRPGWPKMVW